jgi:hypothetical protein
VKLGGQDFGQAVFKALFAIIAEWQVIWIGGNGDNPLRFLGTNAVTRLPEEQRRSRRHYEQADHLIKFALHFINTFLR